MADRPDVDAAKTTLTNWLDAWQNQDWPGMARITNSAGEGMDAKRLSDYFQNRSITKHSEPKFSDGNVGSTFHTDPVSFADFDVSVTLADGRIESFVARVVGLGAKWGVNAVSTMKRTTAPPGKGPEWQRSQKANSSPN